MYRTGIFFFFSISLSTTTTKKKKIQNGADDILMQLNSVTAEIDAIDPNEKKKLQDKKIAEAMERLREANIKRVSGQLYVRQRAKQQSRPLYFSST